MPTITESQTIYYGLQCLAGFNADDLGSDKLFSVRCACVPVEEWTGPMWFEAARVVGVHHKFLPYQFTDVMSFPLIRKYWAEAPSRQAYIDAKAATPRPTEDQLEQVQAMAKRLQEAHKAAAREEYLVKLTPDLGFAVIDRRIAGQDIVKQLPGYCEIDGEVQVWLSDDLGSFIVSHNVSAAPDVLVAITRTVENIKRQAPLGLMVEKASSCADPARYPAKLVEMLRAMALRGVTWTDSGA